MSAVVSIAERARPTGQGGIVAAAALGKGAALILGWHRDRLPRRGIVSVGDGAARGPFRLTAWAHEDAGLCWFVAAIQLQGVLPAPGAAVTLHAQGMADRALATWPGQLEGAREITELLAARAAARPGDLALFLAELVEQAPRGAVLRGVLRRFLSIAATEDGAIEIVGRHGALLMLQGWGRAETEARAIFADGPLVQAPLSVATFSRGDIAPPATGLLESIALAEAWEEAPLAALHVAADGRLWRRPVVPAPQLLGQAETAGHVADMLKRLEADPATLATLGRAARPPFEGAETVSRAGVPLAAALDLVALLPGVGAYVAGWVADPAGAVSAVTLAGEGGFSARLDGVWTRIARPDVVRGLAADHRFARLAGEAHGFAAFVACEVPEETRGLHLAFDLAGGGVAYLPAQPEAGSPRALMRRIAGSIDLHKPSGLPAVQAQLSPLIATAAAIDAVPSATVLCAPPAARVALLLPLLDPGLPPAALLSAFLQDPPCAGEEALTLILGPEWHGGPLAQLEAVLELYGLSAGIVMAEEGAGTVEAWEIGARATAAPLLLCLPPCGHVGPTGWRRALAALVPKGAEAAPQVLAPTLLYEDGSVRSTGFTDVLAEAAPPFFRLRRPFAGLPEAALVRTGAERRGAALAGALVARAAHALTGGFARFGLRSVAQEAGFFLRLGDAGGACRWVPEVTLVAPEARTAAAPWQEAARLADGHALRALWCGAGR
ncbi:MAG: hypothetical protein MUC89_12020 [Acetobacteraceae bacterium]|jgi:hypothetical protein|nr:hypothetical protein [Acetobacteraceae bacterium]